LLIHYQNFSLYSGMSVAQKPKSLTFVGHENGVSNTYLIRFGSDDEATRCKDALQKLIDEVKEK
jgi:nucleoporin NUP2